MAAPTPVAISVKNVSAGKLKTLLIVCACAVLLSAGCGGGGSAGGNGSGSVVLPAGEAALLSPATAAPAMVAQGGTFDMAVSLPQTSPFEALVARPRLRIYLSRSDAIASETILIDEASVTSSTLSVGIPVETPPGRWDLRVTASAPDYTAYMTATAAVAVIPPFSGGFDFVVLTDYHVGDGSVADMAQMPSADLRHAVLTDIASKDYEFALLTGDINSGSWLYQQTYPQARDELRMLDGRPLFPVPGNHDSYLMTVSGQLLDGFVFWDNTFGPKHYSFDVGNYHFTGFNSYEWDDASRSTFSPEARGIIRRPQFDWIMADVASGQARGKQPVLFAHHCPPDSWDPPPCADGPDCNFVTSAQFHAAIRDAGVKWFICGHLHINKLTKKDGVNYVYVSTAGGTTGGTLGWGYNIFHAATDGTLTRQYIEVVHKP